MAQGETLEQLMNRVQLNIDNHRARLGEREEKPPPPFEPQKYTSRDAPEEIDTIEICPAYPDYMVVGTYSLVKKDDPKDYEHQFRKGMLIVMPVGYTFKPSYPGQMAPYCDRKKFPCAVVDIHFHPSDNTLLGVATSNAQMHFFRLIKHADVIGRRIIFKLVSLGSATIAPQDQFGLTPVVTYFDWVGASTTTGTPNVNEKQLVEFVATTTLNEVILVQASFAAVRNLFDVRMSAGLPAMAVSTTVLHTHKLETWCVNASLVNVSEENIYTYLVASGADDSTLVAAGIDITEMGTKGSKLVVPPGQLFIDRKAHTAGVTAVLILESTMVNTSTGIGTEPKVMSPILTGSYDEYLRLFFYDPHARKHRFVLEHKMQGGVWRIKQMDRYAEEIELDISTRIAPDQERRLTKKIHKIHYLLLLSCLHAGANVVRLTHVPHHHLLPPDHERPRRRNELTQTHGWSVQVVAKFSKGHDSMVYGCDFRREYETVVVARPHAIPAAPPGVPHPRTLWRGQYTVVSTSFYDRRICVWTFVDEVQRRLADEAEERRRTREDMEGEKTDLEDNEWERGKGKAPAAPPPGPADDHLAMKDKKAKRRSIGW